MTSKTLLAASLALALFPCLAHAATPAGAASARRLPEVVITAARMAQTVDASLADVSVITRAQISASGAPDLIDLLRREAGIDVARTGGPGQQTSVFIRGTNSNQVLVLVDGVRVASANTGAFAWEQLPLDAVQRIEIVRGPRAAQWGSDAIGGVIQIFTRKLDGPHLAARAGSHGDYAGSAGYGQWGARGGASVIVGARHLAGFPATNAQNFAYNPQPDGYSNQNLAAQGAWRLGTQTVSGSVLRSDARVDFNQGSSRVIEQSAGVNLDGALGANLAQHASLGYDREDLNTPAYASLMLSRRQQASYQLAWTFASGQQLLGGVDWMHERGISRDTGSNTDVYAQSRDNLGAYAGWYGQTGRWNWQLAARHDHNSVFGGATTGSAAAGYTLNDWARVEASFGQGFRSPSLSEQFSPGYFGYYAGNPDLRPERSHSSEVDLLLHPLAGVHMKLAAYRTRVSNLISFAGGSTYQAINIGRAKMEGLELTSTWAAGPWTTRFSGSFDDARDAVTGARLLRRPLRKGDLSLDRSFGSRFSAGLELYAASSSVDYGGVRLGGYSLINAHFDCRLDRDLALRVFLENLADRNYSLAYGYTTPGRSGWVTLSWNL
jgi:vitamin B12 transporter